VPTLFEYRHAQIVVLDHCCTPTAVVIGAGHVGHYAGATAASVAGLPRRSAA
jgi:hypothetical protein